MRYIAIPSSRRHAAGRRTAAHVLSLAGAAVLATGCSFITGVPEVERVRITLANSTVAAQGPGVNVVGEAFDKSGGLVTHRRRVVQFRSSDPAIATVAGAGTNGTVLGIAPGKAWIIGESDGKKDSAQITVTPVRPSRIELEPAFPRVTVAGTARVAVRALNAAGQLLPSYTVGCQSNTPTILSAAASGTNCELRGNAPGAAVLRVIINDFEAQDFNVAVENEVPTAVVPQVRSPLRQSEQVNVDVELRRADGSVIPSAGRNFSYATSNSAVFTVSGAGLLTAQGEGRATLTVREGNVTGTQVIEVTKIPVDEVVLDPNPVYRVEALNSVFLRALDSVPRPLTSLAGRLVRYRAADTSVLRISTSGIVTPLKVGRTEIFVTVDSVTRSTIATVTPVPTGRVAIDSTSVERNPGGTFQYTAQVFDSLNRRITDRPIRWESGNASVVSIGAASGLARAIQPGRVTIVAAVVRVPGFPEELAGQGQFTVYATPVARVEVLPTATSVRVNGTTLVSIIPRDSAGNQLFGRTIRAISENPAVATATSDGINATIRGVTAGTTRIRFQAINAGDLPEGESGVLDVTVNATGAVSVRRAAP